MGKGWADLSLRFAFAHAITRPLSSARTVMANSSLLGKTVKKSGKHRDLNIVGKGIDMALTQLGTTTAFYIGGKIGHTVGLNDHESTFADEAKMLLQFQLGMKLAGNLIRPIGRERREKEKIVVNAATIAEKITGKRDGAQFELVAFSLIESASKSPIAKRSQARMRERLSRETGVLSSSAQRRLKSVLEAAGLKVESVARVKVVNGKEVIIGEVSSRWEKLLKEIEGCK
jgi:hypothetical protein